MSKTKTHATQKDVYSIVNERLIENLEKGVIPWRQPWTNAGLPKNLITGKHYRGINVMLLASLHYPQNCFLTYKQVTELRGNVKKGEKSCPVIFWNWMEKKGKGNDKNETEKFPVLRYYNVFNIAQCEGIPKDKLPPVIERKNDPIISCEEIINNMPNRPEIRQKEHRAYYHPIQDYINMPNIETFINNSSYFGTLFHELIHSSGHQGRLGRKELIENGRFGSKPYAIEELTAEMGACYLKSYAGIPIEDLDNSSAYIKSWLDKLNEDKRFFIHASAQAQKATDYILNILPAEKDVDVSLEQPDQNNKPTSRETEINEVRNNSHSNSLER